MKDKPYCPGKKKKFEMNKGKSLQILNVPYRIN